MKKLSLILLMAVLVTPLFSADPYLTNYYIDAMQAANLQASDFQGLRLPYIRGTWYFVDGASGNAAWEGTSIDRAVKKLSTAYGKCTSGAGDGIVILSRSTASASNSVSETARLTWAKHGITVVGIAAPNGYFGRARITCPSTADSMAALMLVTGSNNTFINLNFTYPADCQSYAGALQTVQRSAVQIAGARNAWINCHFNAYEVNTAGASTSTYAAYQSTGIELRAGSDEQTFDRCYFGSSSYDVAGTAACWIHMPSGCACAQQFFTDCIFVQQSSTGTAFGGLESDAGTTINGVMFFTNCKSAVWRANTRGNLMTSWFIGTKPNSGQILMLDCAFLGFTHLDGNNANDFIYSNQPAGAADGGVGVSTY